MALTISIGTDGRISPRGGSIIPPENAGIGDLIYKNSSGDYKVVGRGATAVPSALSAYTLYGAIYGFVAGMAMVVAPTGATGLTWNANSQSVPSTLPTYASETVLMRNGNKRLYTQMNTARQMVSDTYRGTAGTLVHPTGAYSGGVMTEATYNSDTNSVKSIYGTWKEYLRQTLRVNGAPGSPFGAVADGVKVHEFGRWATAQLQATSTSNFPAANYCYTYKILSSDAEGTWWLPSMFELGELMIDEHWDKLRENSVSGWATIFVSISFWSSVVLPSTNSSAWGYHSYGMSNARSYSNTSTVTRPVTMLKLV